MSKRFQNSNQLAQATHVIFDMDGLLLATEELYTEAANMVAKKFCIPNQKAKSVSWELKVAQMGLQKKDLAQIMVRELQLTCTPDQYLDETYKLHLDLFPKVRHFLKEEFYLFSEHEKMFLVSFLARKTIFCLFA